MKKFLYLLVCLLCATLITVGSYHINSNNKIANQKQSLFSTTKNSYSVYVDDQLIGTISGMSVINDLLVEEANNINDLDPDLTLCLADNVTLKATIAITTNDVEVSSYLKEHDLIGVKTNRVDFYYSGKIYETIYVKNLEDFYSARDKFILNFIDTSTFNLIRYDQEISNLAYFGTKDVDMYIKEKIVYTQGTATLETVFNTEEQIYEFLCYGRDTARSYYKVQAGDTLDNIGYSHGGLTAYQIYSLNSDVLSSTDQILAEGLILNVTYFKSPITVVVSKQRLIQEKVTPEIPKYITTSKLRRGVVRIVTAEKTGLSNVLYEETWENGIITDSTIITSTVVRDPVRGEIWLGPNTTYNAVGSGEFIWPVDYPHMTYGYQSYRTSTGLHHGIDLINTHNRSGYIYATDTGTVETVSYNDYNGYWVMINHNNGYRTIYGHLAQWASVKQGQVVNKGDIIGIIGNTGNSYGRHCHLGMYYGGKQIDPCSVYDCSQVR